MNYRVIVFLLILIARMPHGDKSAWGTHGEVPVYKLKKPIMDIEK